MGDSLMLRLTLAQMRRSLGRLTAAGIAIAIGTAFVAATLLAGAVITRTSHDAVAASYADADLVVAHPDGLPAATVAAIREQDGVAAADGRLSLHVELSNGGRRSVQELTAVASDPRLDAQEVVGGRTPQRTGEVALPAPLAERLDVDLGDLVAAHAGARVVPDATVGTADSGAGDPGGGLDAGDAPGAGDAAGAGEAGDPATGPTPTWVERPEELTVVGVVDDPFGAFAGSGGAAVLTAADLARWAASESSDAEVTYRSAVLVLADDTSPAAVRAALADVAPPGSTVRTKTEQAEVMTAELTGGTDIFTTIVLGFAAVALLVAALVISNTFQVLIAQRTRTLALLRCIGADRRRLRRSVLLEAGILGVTASTAGLLLGVGIGQGALWALSRMELEVPLPTGVTLTPAVVVVPLLVGTLVTVVASLAPARAATRVPPLAALRPADAPAVTRRRDLPRLVLAAVLTLGGLALLTVAVVVGAAVPVLALGVGILGGALSFVGVVIGSVFWLPRVVSLCGRVIGRGGTSARLAAANTVRNPRRTAATSTALLIGVTLVTMMSTGAASARVTLVNELDAQFPVDVQIGGGSTAGTDGEPLVTPALVRTVEAVDGVALVTPLTQASVTMTAADGSTTSVVAFALGAADATALLRTPAMVEGLTDSTVVLSQDTAVDLGIRAGDDVTVSASGVTTSTDGASTDGAPSTDEPTGPGAAVVLTAVVTSIPGGAVVTPATLDALRVADAEVQAWVRLADDADPAQAVPAIQDALLDTPVQVTGAAVERAMFEDVIDTLLAVVVGLLAVAVVLALVGVANTLSLSVLERRRESATLRVIGLSRRQLRATLAIEGMLIAGVGAALGVVLGVLYGWAGAATVLGVVGAVTLQVPWTHIAVVLVVALVAGLLASVLPGRSAARTSPVAALAVD